MELDELRNRKDINLNKLAKAIGYSRAHLQGIRDGRYNPGQKLIKALESTVEYKKITKKIICVKQEQLVETMDFKLKSCPEQDS